MLGILVQLAISWLLIYFIQKKNLSVLGLTPTTSRLSDFLVFFLLAAACCAMSVLLKILVVNQQWLVNPALTFNLFAEGLWWNIKSVLFEELIFRGVLLYILIKRLGATKAIMISAIAFGIYHWFSFNVLGNPMGMAIAFFTTGVMGLVLAYGYAKTFSLYIPIAIHLGWNFTQIFVFSQGPIGDGIFVPEEKGPFLTDSYPIFFLVTFLPMLLVLTLAFLLIRRHKQVATN